MKTAIVLALLLSIALVATGCRRQDAVGSTMSDKQQNALNANLAKLEDTLRDKSPFIFAKLAPSATNEELATLQSELGGVQIQGLELWYGWHNGCTDRGTDILPLGRMLSIAEALEDRKMTQGIPFVDAKRKNALKILEDGAGDGFFLDIASANPRVFYHMLEDPDPRDYGTLQEFVAFIRDVHAAGLATKKENGMVAFDLDRYQKVEADYLQKLQNP